MQTAILRLETGQSFQGQSPDWQQQFFFGEVVFNTGMVGYTETLTDPSYAGQLLCLTYPLVGNYGVPSPETWESERIQAAGVITSSICDNYSHHSATQSFTDWLKDQQVPLLTGVDTRALTKLLSHQGVVAGAICPADHTPEQFIDINQQHLVKERSINAPRELGGGNKRIIVVDCGIKQNILRHLQRFDIQILQVPFDYDYSKEQYDGIFISNGPGDPTVCQETIDILQKQLKNEKPIFGICLGCQILALAIGASTYKLRFGHRAQNHPCLDLRSNRCFLTSQNHGFAIKEDSLPSGWQVTYRNLNDDSVQGIAHTSLPYFAVQFHPEAAPGPIDTRFLFDTFYEAL